MKVYAVYSIPKSPEYRLEKLFRTKEGAKEYIEKQKRGELFSKEFREVYGGQEYCNSPRKSEIFDIQIEEIEE